MEDREVIGGALQVKPNDCEFTVEAGENIRDAALRNGYRWPSTCSDLAECMLCFVEVLEGEDNLGPNLRTRAGCTERPTMPNVTGLVRLACQTSITGDVVVKKRGVRLIDKGIIPTPD